MPTAIGSSGVMVIARFSHFAFLAIQAGLLGLTFGIWWPLFAGVHNRYGVPASQDPVTWILCALSPFFLWLGFAQARQFLFHGRRAVWIENGVLYCFSQLGPRPIMAVPLEAISGVSPGQFVDRLWVRLKTIRIEAEDGKRGGEFLTWPLSERRDVVLTRLNQALADSRR